MNQAILKKLGITSVGVVLAATLVGCGGPSEPNEPEQSTSMEVTDRLTEVGVGKNSIDLINGLEGEITDIAVKATSSTEWDPSEEYKDLTIKDGESFVFKYDEVEADNTTSDNDEDYDRDIALEPTYDLWVKLSDGNEYTFYQLNLASLDASEIEDVTLMAYEGIGYIEYTDKTDDTSVSTWESAKAYDDQLKAALEAEGETEEAADEAVDNGTAETVSSQNTSTANYSSSNNSGSTNSGSSSTAQSATSQTSSSSADNAASSSSGGYVNSYGEVPQDEEGCLTD